MGGYGSGRPGFHATTGACRSIDLKTIRHTVGWRQMSWSLGGESYGSITYAMTAEALKLRYKLNGEDQDVAIPITKTSPNLGGERQWLRCRCGRRCRIVYLGPQGWRCRKCYRLTYQTQRDDAQARAQRQAEKISRRLGGDDFDWLPDRPKGMHQRTYNRLADRFDLQHHKLDRALLHGLDRLMQRWGRADA